MALSTAAVVDDDNDLNDDTGQIPPSGVTN